MNNKNSKELRCEDIFQTNLDPNSLTYVERRQIALKIRSALDRKQSCFVIGPSKVGKTLLVKKILEIDMGKSHPVPSIILHSNQLHELDYLDEQINVWMEYFNSLSLEERIEAYGHDISISELIIVIDDIHYVDYELALDLFDKIKHYIDQGFRFILIGVNSQKLREVRGAKGDLGGRLIQIELSLWEFEDLEKIARRGFNEKNVSVRPLGRLANESFGTPFLMQFLCGLCCSKYLLGQVKESTSFILQLSEDDIDEILELAGMSFTNYEHIYDVLTEYDACYSDRVFKRHDGKKGNFNQLLFYTLSGKYPKWAMPITSIHREKLRGKMREILHPDEELLTTNEISAYLNHLKNFYKFYQDTRKHDPIIDYKKHYLVVNDTAFYIYLRNSRDVEDSFFD